MNSRLANILDSDRYLERLARAYALAGVDLPAAASGFAAAALAAGHFRGELVLEGYHEAARIDYLLTLSMAHQKRKTGSRPAQRAAIPQLLPWLAIP